MKYTFLKKRLDRAELSHFDIYFAEFMAELSKVQDARLVNLFANLAHADALQHSCLIVEDESLIEALVALPTVTTEPDQASINTPLVLVANKLYLHRYYMCEVQVAEQLSRRNKALPWRPEALALLEQLFEASEEIDWQKVAAFQCLSRQLTLISGGPGTGKTSTIVKILAILKTESPEMSIHLAAPTGKAAMRLSTAISSALSRLPAKLQATVPTQVSTIHRLLGMRADGYSFKYHQNNRLNADLLILDETSMVDLLLMQRLLAALPDHCRLIFVGDPDQLPSVETGAVFRDLDHLGLSYSADYAMELSRLKLTPKEGELAGEDKVHQLQDAMVTLRHSYRFSEDSKLGALAYQIRKQLPTELLEDDDEVRLVTSFDENDVLKHLLEHYQPFLKACGEDTDAASLLQSFDNFRALAPMKHGPLGVENLNRLMEQQLQTGDQVFYHGKPVMIKRNDYQQQLFNGDIGICILSDDGEMLVAFPPISTRSEDESGVRYFLPGRLPGWETCFVMTVHKAQGSEFDRVSLIIPPDGAELVNNELIYTAITRARSGLTLFADPLQLEAIVARRVDRVTGLSDMLRRLV